MGDYSKSLKEKIKCWDYNFNSGEGRLIGRFIGRCLYKGYSFRSQDPNKRLDLRIVRTYLDYICREVKGVERNKLVLYSDEQQKALALIVGNGLLKDLNNATNPDTLAKGVEKRI